MPLEIPMELFIKLAATRDFNCRAHWEELVPVFFALIDEDKDSLITQDEYRAFWNALWD